MADESDREVLDIDETLAAWGQTLCRDIDIGSLLARNATVHKWKVTYFFLLLRECVSWRMHDLLQQARLLQKSGMTLGANVLLRSAVETLAMLVYQNEMANRLMEGSLPYDDFFKRVRTLCVGSRDGSTPFQPINIMTVLEKSKARHPHLLEIYNSLSEVAHPNHEGMVAGYSKDDRPAFRTDFANLWQSRWDGVTKAAIALVISTYHIEYNEVSVERFERLERWLVDQDGELEPLKHLLD